MALARGDAFRRDLVDAAEGGDGETLRAGFALFIEAPSVLHSLMML